MNSKFLISRNRELIATNQKVANHYIGYRGLVTTLLGRALVVCKI